MKTSSTKKEGKPFIKWAGGKTQLLQQLKKNMPKNYNKYIEPFLGGGALYFDLNHGNSVISDLNEELIITYKTVQQDVERLIDVLKNIENSEENFYKIRAQNPEELPDISRAARFIYLNKTCFNGLYRVNKKGKFNVPYGKKVGGNFLQEERLIECSSILKNTIILHSKYQDVLEEYCKKGDFVFLDPPYYPVGKFSDFKRYTKESFYHEDQVELRDQFVSLVNKGCNVLLTNSNHQIVLELYKEFEIVEVQTKRMINKDASNRKGVDIIVIGK